MKQFFMKFSQYMVSAAVPTSQSHFRCELLISDGNFSSEVRTSHLNLIWINCLVPIPNMGLSDVNFSSGQYYYRHLLSGRQFWHLSCLANFLYKFSCSCVIAYPSKLTSSHPRCEVPTFDGITLPTWDGNFSQMWTSIWNWELSRDEKFPKHPVNFTS